MHKLTLHFELISQMLSKNRKEISTANEYFILTFHKKDTNDNTLKDRIEVLYISSSRIHHKSKVRTKGVEN